MIEYILKDLSSFIFLVIAGMINGSFAVFTKYTTKWKFENIWLQFCLWAFFILPWIFSFFLIPQIFSVYNHASIDIITIMIVGGLIFGIGQICFALAIKTIGIGLGFVINLGLGISLGSLLPLVIQHPDQILTIDSLLIFIAVILGIIGIVVSNYAGMRHHKEKTKKINNYFLGMIMAIFAGLASAGQNLSFSLTNSMQQYAFEIGASHIGASIVMWPGFLLASFIPYVIFMVTLNVKNKSFKYYLTRDTKKYYLFALFMGLFWFGSLIFYSEGAYLIGKLGPVIGWPLFMILIILTSNFWSWKKGEWEGCTKRIKNILWLGISFLIAAILLLAFAHFI